MGLRSEAYATPITRQGIVAGLGEQGFLLDAFVFPGNSGGPVIYKPVATFVGGATVPHDKYEPSSKRAA